MHTYTTNRIFIQRQSCRSFCFTQRPCDDSPTLGLCTHIRITDGHLHNRTVAVNLNILYEPWTLQQTHTTAQHLNNVTIVANITHMNCGLIHTKAAIIEFVDFRTGLKHLMQ